MEQTILYCNENKANNNNIKVKMVDTTKNKIKVFVSIQFISSNKRSF